MYERSLKKKLVGICLKWSGNVDRMGRERLALTAVASRLEGKGGDEDLKASIEMGGS